MLDTGAQVNLITAKRAKEIGVETIDTRKFLCIQGITKNTIRTIGSIWVSLKIADFVIPTEFYVVQDLSIPAILGAKFIKKHLYSIEENFKAGVFKTNAMERLPYMQEDRVSWDILDFILRGIGDPKKN